MDTTKRQSGQVKDKKWLVLTESTGKEKVGFRHRCGVEIQGRKVAHPIHDGPFPLSGGGRVHYETVPFCPECETEPNFHGSPIDHDPVEVKEMQILITNKGRKIAKYYSREKDK